MSSWADLIEALAAPSHPIGPSMPRRDLWDEQFRIEALETEVRHLSQILKQVLEQLQQDQQGRE